ncbi:MAG: hypothetical protein ACO3RV_10200, partial [Luteolibacter sp.]
LWTWLRPYAWNPDPAAAYRIEAAQVKHDTGYYWLDLHLRRVDAHDHDCMKTLQLISQSGREIEPADIRFGRDSSRGHDELWLKFWLEPGDFDGPLRLEIQDGVLDVRSGRGIPNLGKDDQRNYTTSHW